MKTFDDLKFELHPVTKKAIRATLELEPGTFISVVAGEGMYSGGKNGIKGPVTKLEEATTFEVAIISENLPDGEQELAVNGWQTREDINRILSKF